MEIKTQNHRNSQNHDPRLRTLTWVLIQREFISPDPNRISISSTKSHNSSNNKFDVMEFTVVGEIKGADESGVSSMSPRNILDCIKARHGFSQSLQGFFFFRNISPHSSIRRHFITCCTLYKIDSVVDQPIKIPT